MLVNNRNFRNDTGDKVMINPQTYLDFLQNLGVEFFAGVPDSLLKDFCACVTDGIEESSHFIAANEGAAVGLALGHHLGTGKVPLVYMQNSGLGNTVNPLMSLASSEVYGVPMLLMIGWRGEPGAKDEPQHVHQGRVMLKMLEAMEIPALILSENAAIAYDQTKTAFHKSQNENSPIALIVKKGLFETHTKAESVSMLQMTREEAIVEVASLIEPDGLIVATTGMASRELFEYRAANRQGHDRDFLTVGGMGHASQIALGLSLAQPNKSVYCFDGDGAVIMHLGSLGVSGTSGCNNLKHIVFNNGAHGSVGGQPTIGFDIDLCAIAVACGYENVAMAETTNKINSWMHADKKSTGPSFLEVRTLSVNRSNIGRPTSSPRENKFELMRYLEVVNDAEK